MKTPKTSLLARVSTAGVLTLAMLAASSTVLHATDIPWIGGTAEYTNTIDWTGGVVPGSGDNAINDNGSNNVVQILGTDPTWNVNDIRAANGANASGAYVQNGSAVILGGWFRLGIGTGATGIYTLNSGSIQINANRLNVGELGTGVMNIFGGTINGPNNQFALADGPTGASGTVYQTAGTVNSPGELWVGANNAGSGGNGSVGVYNFSGGTLNINNWVAIGRNGTAGTINMSGGAFNKNNNGEFLVGSGNGSIGTVNQTGGSIVAQNQFLVPEAGDGTTLGTYNISNNASLLVNSWIAVGRNGGVGVANIAGGSVTKTGSGSDHIVIGAGGPGTVNQTGGAVTNTASDTWIGENGAGVWNMNGGTATFGSIHIAQTTGNGTFNLNAGNVSATEITTGNPSSVSILNFNGGTLQASANTANFIHGVFIVQVQSGGLVLDSQGFNVTIPQALPTQGDGSGGLTKIGTGVLTLTGANTYTGPTLVNAGTLVLTTSLTGPTGQGDYTVAGGAQLNLAVQALNDQLNVNNLTFGTGVPVLNLDMGAFGNPSSAPVNALAALTVNGAVSVNIADALPQLGQFPLIHFASKSGAGSFVLGSLPIGVGAYISNNVSSIDLVITNVNLPRWEGLAGGNWDIGLTTNWINIGNSLPTTYADHNIVQFNDSAVGTTTVNLTTTVNPNGLTVNNNSLPYTFVGTGKISGPVGIVKQGPGTLAVLNTGGNNYTGPTVLSGGTLSVTNLTNGGLPSPIGAGSANPTNLVLSGGSLSYSGPAVTINRGYLVQTTNGGITTVSNLTLSGLATATSAGGFIKSGDATLTYTGGSNVLSAAGSVTGYGVQGGTVVFDGSAGGQTNYANTGIAVDGFNTNATVTLTNTTMNDLGDFNLGDIANAYGTLNVPAGSTLNVGGWFIYGNGGNSGGTVNLNGGTINQPSGNILMGGFAGANSTLNINSGTYNKTGGAISVAPGNWNGSGARIATINQTGGTFTSSAEMDMGQVATGSGYYNLSGGTLNSSGGLYIGNSGGFGQFTMTGGAINQSGGNPIKVGNGGGVAFLNQSGGTITSSSEYWVAENGGTVGSNNISGTAAVNVSTYVTVGRAGTGVVNMSGGTFTQTGGNPFFVGIFGGGNGFWYHTGGTLGISATFEIGSACNGYVELDNGVITAGAQTWIAQSAGAVSSLNINGGIYTNTSWLAVGREDGHGTLNLNGGLYIKNGDGNISIAHGLGDANKPAGTVIQTGGTFIAQTGDTWIGEDNGPGIWNISGGSATMNQVLLAKNSSATGELDLNGGTFTANQVTTASSGASTLNFNGGTLAASINNAAFLSGLTVANVQAGGAVIDSGANTIGISQPLLNSVTNSGGGLTKKGSGTLTMTGANTYTGPTTVNAGKLILTTGSTGGGNVTVSNAAAFGVTVVGALNSQYVVPGLSFAGATASLNFDLGSFGNPASAPFSVTTLNNNATVTVNIAAAVPAAGQVPLLKYTGSISGTGSFVLGTIPTGSVGYLSNNVANSSIDFVVTSAGAPRWNGNVSSVWDINTTANWFDLGTLSSTTYHDGTPVLFDDNATGATNVMLSVTVAPASVRFTNNLIPYTLAGSGNISGATGLTKQGTNTLTLNMNGNTFTGPVSITGNGALIVTNLANGGSPSAIGASSANPTNVVLGGGTLSYAGPAVAINRGYSLTANSVLDTRSNLTLSGTALASAGTLLKTGAGTLTYAGANTNVLSPANVGGAFQVQNGTVVLDGTVGGQSNSVIGELWVASVPAAAANLVVTNSTLGISSWFALGRGNGNSNWVSTAAIYNSTMNVSYANTGTPGNGGGVSLGYNNGLPNAGTQILTLAGTTTLANSGGLFNIGESSGSTSILNVTNSAAITSLTSRDWIGGTSARAIWNMNSSATSTISTTSGQIFLGGTSGTGDTGIGALNQTAGTIRFGNGGGQYLHIGANGGTVSTSYGSFALSGGSFNETTGDGIRLGYGGYGSLVQSGGTLNIGRYLAVGGNTSSGNGVATFTGGTATINPQYSIHLPDAGSATAAMNLGTEAGGTATVISLSVNNGSGVVLENAAGGNGTLNLNSGTLQLANPIYRANSTGGSAVVNMNGGTLQAGANNITLMDNSPSSENVYRGGLTVDTAANVATISGNLLATTGNGIYPAGGIIKVTTNGGAGYVGAPLVTVNGGSGAGAMAIATVIGGVVTNVAITAPGKNYVAGDSLTFAFVGGGSSTVASNLVYTLQAGDLAANSTGGLTKIGTGTLYLNGASTFTGPTLVSFGTLGGTGTLASPVTVASGSTLSPGTGGIGTLTVNSSLSLAAGSTTAVDVNKTAGTKDLVTGVSTLTYGGTLVVNNLAGTLASGDSFKLFNATTYSGSFSAISPTTPGAGLTWDVSQLAVSGTLGVVTASSVNTNPTNIVSSVSGGNLNLSWPADHIGWRLLVQTNSRAVGLTAASNTWSTVPGSATTNAVSIPIITANPTVFYRLTYP
ncbi:MAG TPA: autotransporter-associated beta strand repeat-containing protein [Verrucomicrobiae bacterium]|nr:autotransporter-associated beta strand repeat-containing protein [Verrucomicrobiae bacterium]